MKFFLPIFNVLGLAAALTGQPVLTLGENFREAEIAPFCRVLKIPDSTARPTEIARLDAENLLRGQQDERRRLRLRLHDGLGILLASTRMRLSKLSAGDEKLRAIERDIAAAATETRNLSHDLDPEALREGRLLDAISDTVARAQNLSPAEISFSVDENFDEKRLAQRQKIALFYIAQELLHNSLKHAEASEIKVFLTFFDEKIALLRVEDNGKGFPGAEDLSTFKKLTNLETGIGLDNIRARVEAVGGRFEVQERLGGGLVCEVCVEI